VDNYRLRSAHLFALRLVCCCI